MLAVAGGADSIDLRVAASARVLVVDHRLLLADALKLALVAHGFRHVVVVDDLDHEAIVVAAERFKPDVVLLDVDLGGCRSALPLVAPLARLGAGVIAITDGMDLTALGAALEAGAVGLITTSDGPGLLIEIINSIASGRPAVSSSSRHDLLLALASERRQLAPLERLSQCERQVLALLSDGMTAQQIAAYRFVSLTTVRSQIRSVLRKLEVSSQVAAVALARQRQWKPPVDYALDRVTA